MFSFSRDNDVNDLILDPETGLSISHGASAVGGALDAIVKTVRGELAFDTLRGVPYFTTVFQGVISLPEWEEEMRTAIRSCPHVTELVSFETKVDRESGTISYTATVETDEGEVSASGTLGNGHWNVAQENSVGDIDGYVLGERTVYHIDRTVLGINVAISGSSFSLRVRTIESATVSVSWGDGNVTSGVTSSINDMTLTHMYSGNGRYDVEISSGASRIAIGEADSSADASKSMLVSVYNLSGQITNLHDSFSYCTNLTGYIPDISKVVVDLGGCFKGCVGLTGSVPSWGEAVTDVSECYYGCTGLTGVIPAWGGAITDAESCYYGCSGLTEAWTNDYALLMPSIITSHVNCVTGCGTTIRDLFRYDWGGTQKILPNSTYGDLRLAINWYKSGTPLAEDCDGTDMVVAANDISTTVVIGMTDPVSRISDSVRTFQ